MSKKSSSKTNFLAQGTILVIASFVAKAIGMIYRIPLTHILGDDGNGYYSTANEIYTIILMISSFSLPLAVSRLVAEREYAGEVKNSYKVLICSLRFAADTAQESERLRSILLYSYVFPFLSCNILFR